MKMLFFLQLKRAVKAVPRLLAGAVLPLILAGMAVFWAFHRPALQTKSILSPVALVNHDSEAYLNFILPMITEAEAASSFSFVLMEEKEAMLALEKGSVCAVLLLPEQMFSGILDSTNVPARLYLPEGDSFPSLLLAKFAEAGALTLGSAQAGIYAASDLYREYGLTEYRSDIYTEINLANLKYALDREATFSSRSATATGELSLTEYYGSTLLLCLLLSLGAGMGSCLCTTLPPVLHGQLKRNGIRGFCFEASLCLPFVLFYLAAASLLMFAVFVLFPEVSFSPVVLFFLLGMVLCLAAYTQLLFTLFRNAGQGLFAYTFSGLLMLFSSGGFLPYAFLPNHLTALTPFLPLGACLSGLRRLFVNGLTFADGFLLLAHVIFLFLLLAGLSAFREKEVAA